MFKLYPGISLGMPGNSRLAAPGGQLSAGSDLVNTLRTVPYGHGVPSWPLFGQWGRFFFTGINTVKAVPETNKFCYQAEPYRVLASQQSGSPAARATWASRQQREQVFWYPGAPVSRQKKFMPLRVEAAETARASGGQSGQSGGAHCCRQQPGVPAL